MRLHALAFVILAALPACGSSDRGGSRIVIGACVEGQTRACTCTDGRPGAQTCVGGGFSACSCTGVVPDASSSSDSGFTPGEDGGFTPHDAGFWDGGANDDDAGFWDSGVPPIDAGFYDSGVPRDAGFYDSGVRPDAGFYDSGVRDTGGPTPDAGPIPCISDNDCAFGSVCTNNFCGPGCLDPLGPVCPGGVMCNPLTGRCGGICLADAECPPGNLCHYILPPLPIGACGPPCNQSGGITCPSGLVCSGNGHCQ